MESLLLIPHPQNSHQGSQERAESIDARDLGGGHFENGLEGNSLCVPSFREGQLFRAGHEHPGERKERRTRKRC